MHRRIERHAWATYNSVEACAAAAKVLDKKRDKKKLDDFTLSAIVNDSKTMPVPRRTGKQSTVAPSEASSDARIAIDIKQSGELCRALDKEKGISENLFGENADDQFGVGPKRLDLQIAYLRLVHLFDYYSGEEFDDECEMVRLAGFCHLRRKYKAPPSEEGHPQAVLDEFAKWCELVDSKCRARLDAATAMLDGGKEKQKEAKLSGLFCEQVKELESGMKYGCGYCDKKFRGADFVRRHIMNKHEKEVADALYFKNYEDDPNRPTRTPQMVIMDGPRGGGKDWGKGPPFMGWGKGGPPFDHGPGRFPIGPGPGPGMFGPGPGMFGPGPPIFEGRRPDMRGGPDWGPRESRRGGKKDWGRNDFHRDERHRGSPPPPPREIRENGYQDNREVSKNYVDYDEPEKDEKPVSDFRSFRYSDDSDSDDD
jgi:hypothetical protein